MTFQESIRICFAKYADFNGTASRSEYWWFALFLILAGAVASVISPSWCTIFYLVTLLPWLAAGARRLHETGRSGWVQLVVLIPLAGIGILAIFMAQEGKETAAVPEATGVHQAGV